MEKRTFLILFVIFIIALFFRIFDLLSLPLSLHTDELFAGYVGRYIFLHGQDIYGNVFPLFINKFGDFRPIGIFWLSGLSTFIFGVNEFGIRFPVALIGSMTVFPTYLFSYKLFNNKKLALLASIFLAILPWHIVLSRSTSEAIVGLFFFLFSMCFMLIFIKKERLRDILFSLLFGLSAYLFYHSFRIILPLAFLPLVLFLKNKRAKIIGILVTIIFLLITIYLGSISQGNGRFNQVAFYNDTRLTNTIEFLKAGEGINHVLLARIFHNKLVVYGRGFVTQYLSYFSPQFLFDDKGLPARYVTPEQGLLYYMFIPFLFLSVLFFIPFQEKNKKGWLIYYLLGISVLPAALTYEDSPNISRAVVMIVPFVILGALGFYALLTKIKFLKLRKYLLVLCIVFLSVEFVYFWHEYSVHAKTYQPYQRNEGNKELISYILKNKGKYEHIYLPSEGDLPVYYLFYTNNFEKLKPGMLRKIESGGKLDGINFINDQCLDYLIKTNKLKVPKNSLIIETGDCENVGYPTKVIVERSDGTNAYKVFEIH